jgi:hypothetical protein
VLLPDLPLFLARLAELTQSSNETIRLQALKEIFDRLCGRSAVFVDATHTKVDVGALAREYKVGEATVWRVLRPG